MATSYPPCPKATATVIADLSNAPLFLPDTNSEHIQNRSSLNPPQNHNETNYAEWIEGQLGSQNIHALLKWGFWGLFSLHHLENFTKFRFLTGVYYDSLNTDIRNICKMNLSCQLAFKIFNLYNIMLWHSAVHYLLENVTGSQYFVQHFFLYTSHIICNTTGKMTHQYGMH